MLHFGPALYANIRIGWMQMAMANTLAYYNTGTKTAISFIVLVPKVVITNAKTYIVKAQ